MPFDSNMPLDLAVSAQYCFPLPLEDLETRDFSSSVLRDFGMSGQL
jgi:hypothetical protein